MATSAFYTTQVFASGSGRAHSPTPSSNTSLVESTRYTERPSIELKFSSSGAKITNAVVVDPVGRPLYSISSDSKCTKLLSHKDNTEVATIDWERQSPRMVFRGKKHKCHKWLRSAGPNTKYVLMPLLHARRSLSWDGMVIRSRIFVHGDSRFRWLERPSHGFVSPSRPTTSPVRRLIEILCSSFRPTGQVSPWPSGRRNHVMMNSVSRYSKRHLSSLAYSRRSSFRSYYSNPDSP
jgi:hypothetical protein